MNEVTMLVGRLFTDSDLVEQEQDLAIGMPSKAAQTDPYFEVGSRDIYFNY